jgi:hypothetical protein
MHPANPVPARAMRTALVLLAVGLAACTTSTASGSPASSAAVVPPSIALVPPSVAASPSEAPSDNPSGPPPSYSDATAVPTDIDPCQLITAEEAGTLVGTTFGAGEESTTEGNARICTYGAQTKNVFIVEVAIAPDEATAKADEAAAQAELQSKANQLPAVGLAVTQLPDFAPGADAALMGGSMSLGGTTIGASAIYVLRGTTFFGFSDVALNQAPPTADAMKAEAMTVLGRLP